jgi:hypothetical protein
MKWQVLDSSETEAWHQALSRQPVRDVYFTPEYHSVHEKNGDGTARAFIACDRGQELFYPFMMRPIEAIAGQPLADTWFDIESVYGYTGPLATTSDQGFLSEAWNCFDSWCKNNRVIAEFVRFNPMVDNSRFADSSHAISLDRQTVVVNLNCTEEELWQSYSSSHRNKIRKAEKNGLECAEMQPEQGIRPFKKLYSETMSRVEADEYYFFSDNYFNCLAQWPSDKLRLFAVRSEERVVAASLFLLSSEHIHYHLTGSSQNAMHLGPVPLLLHKVALWGIEHGFRILHLGGGSSSDPHDSLFTFKASISKLRRSFFTGRRVHNPEIFDQFCSLWLKRTGVSPRPNYFLLYRLHSAEYGVDANSA